MKFILFSALFQRSQVFGNFMGGIYHWLYLLTGDTDGIIPESVEVYKVQKNANAYDYHQNVNRDGFMNWFKRLLDLWKTKQVD